jgi:hypothetical protein
MCPRMATLDCLERAAHRRTMRLAPVLDHQAIPLAPASGPRCATNGMRHSSHARRDPQRNSRKNERHDCGPARPSETHAEASEHDAGFVVRALQSHPLVRDRTNLVNARFESADGKRHAFVSPKCRKSIECYERLAYKEGTSEPDKDSGYDHLPDSAGYYFFARFSHKPVFRTNVGHMHR